MATRMREKSAKRAEERDMRPKAVARYIRMSPYKVRQVLDIVRGKDYAEAVAILSVTPRAAAPVVKKLLNSAAANAENNLSLSKDDLIVAEIFADQGPSLKRMQPRAQGRAFSILKRTSHITVILDVKGADAKAMPQVKADAKAKPAAKAKTTAKAGAKTDVKAEAKPVAKAKAAVVKADAKTDIKTDAKPAAKAKTTAKADVKTDVKAEAKPAAKAKAVSAKPAAKAEPDVKAKTE